MKKYTFFFICCLISFFTAVTAFAQVGFTGPQGFTGQPGITGQYGYTGQVQTVTVVQAQAFANRTPVIITGTIVQSIGGDNYIFRDSSGEIILKISYETVHFHQKNLYRKLGIQSRAELFARYRVQH